MDCAASTLLGSVNSVFASPAAAVATLTIGSFVAAASALSCARVGEARDGAGEEESARDGGGAEEDDGRFPAARFSAGSSASVS